jgi:hypothetical protein
MGPPLEYHRDGRPKRLAVNCHEPNVTVTGHELHEIINQYAAVRTNKLVAAIATASPTVATSNLDEGVWERPSVGHALEHLVNRPPSTHPAEREQRRKASKII